MCHTLSTLPCWMMMFAMIFSLIGYFVACLAGWYVLAGIGYTMRGGQLGRSKLLFPFECFLEELPCYLPGGQLRRVQYVKELFSDSGEIRMKGSKRTWTYDEIQKEDLYEKAFFDMCSSRFSFWLYHLVVFFVGGPLIVIALACVLLVGGVTYSAWSTVTNKPIMRTKG